MTYSIVARDAATGEVGIAKDEAHRAAHGIASQSHATTA